MVSVPIELPGANVPPLMVVLPTVPLPPSVPPAFTVMAELAIEPFTDSVPALIAQDSAAALVPVKVQVLLPVFWKLPKPWYCALAPICETIEARITRAAEPQRIGRAERDHAADDVVASLQLEDVGAAGEGDGVGAGDAVARETAGDRTAGDDGQLRADDAGAASAGVPVDAEPGGMACTRFC